VIVRYKESFRTTDHNKLGVIDSVGGH